ncbi:MAG: hypothetical protein ACXWIN_06855 [Burkholderiaceae bacterium]
MNGAVPADRMPGTIAWLQSISSRLRGTYVKQPPYGNVPLCSGYPYAHQFPQSQSYQRPYQLHAYPFSRTPIAGAIEQAYFGGSRVPGLRFGIGAMGVLGGIGLGATGIGAAVGLGAGLGYLGGYAAFSGVAAFAGIGLLAGMYARHQHQSNYFYSRPLMIPYPVRYSQYPHNQLPPY